MSNDLTLRVATSQDVESLIELMLLSSNGGIQDAWDRARPPHRTWREQATVEIQDPYGDLGYRNYVVAAFQDHVLGMILINHFEGLEHLRPEVAEEPSRSILSLLKTCAHSVFIRELAVRKEVQGRGIAGVLMNIAEDMCLRTGKPRVALMVNSENTVAYNLYRKRGFIETGREPCLGHRHYSNLSFRLVLEKRMPAMQPAESAPQSSR